MLINAVQGLVGRIDRGVGADGRRAAYHEVVELLKREFHLRFPPAGQSYVEPEPVYEQPAPTYYQETVRHRTMGTLPPPQPLPWAEALPQPMPRYREVQGYRALPGPGAQ